MSAAVLVDDRTLLVRYVRRFCPAWLRNEEEDLVQMAAVRVMRAGSEVQHRRAYLRQAAYSTVVDEVRRLRRRMEVGMSPSMHERVVNSMELNPETVARGAQVGAVLVDALGTLSVDRKRAVTLYLQSHPVPDIAVMLGCDRKRASNLVYRGIADLRNELARRGVRP